ncbi:MAG: monovalent cation/H(+) antiporter subunit G [Halomonadaceae bacterium]|nr:MAG: monovalent cation/H(+) antiporter subunit G [Halomonadaceae bacterium]
MILNLFSIVFGLLGAVFFLAGTIGMLRFPDVFCRLHAQTKADNQGLGFIITALLLQADSVWVALKLILIWLVMLLASANISYLIGRYKLRQHSEPE